MKHLKTFESWETPMTKEEMMDYLCDCGISREELMDKEDFELNKICKEMQMKEESWGMSKEEMMEYLCRSGYPLKELMVMDEKDLHTICMETGQDSVSEKKKWIQDAIKKPGALRSKLNKKEGEKITNKEIDEELSKLKKKDKDPDKKGIQLNRKDAKTKRQLELAKRLRNM